MRLKRRIPDYLETIELLLSNPATKVDFGNYHFKVLCFLFAVEGEDTVLSRLFMKRNGTDSDPAVHGPEGTHQAIIRTLTADKDFDVDRQDNVGRTLLSYAAQEGCTRVLRALMETGRVNVTLRDHNGQSPVDWAMRSRCRETLPLMRAPILVCMTWNIFWEI
jgi:hypothetical protein